MPLPVRNAKVSSLGGMKGFGRPDAIPGSYIYCDPFTNHIGELKHLDAI